MLAWRYVNGGDAQLEVSTREEKPLKRRNIYVYITNKICSLSTGAGAGVIGFSSEGKFFSRRGHCNSPPFIPNPRLTLSAT